jgi:hypothetical protein
VGIILWKYQFPNSNFQNCGKDYSNFYDARIARLAGNGQGIAGILPNQKNQQ